MGKVGDGFKNFGKGFGDFLTLQWLLDPGKDERQRALSNAERATGRWLSAEGDAPTAREIFNREDEVNPGSSQFAGLHSAPIEDEAGRDAQLQALRQMQGIASAGGYTSLERDQIAQAQRQAAGYERSQRDAVMQQAQMRGMGGGGAQLASQLQAQQSGANRAQTSATDIATAAQMRALQAMQGAGQMGSQQQSDAAARQSQLHGQSAQRAGAIDAFNQANTTRRQGVAQRNTAGRTAATNQAWQNQVDVLAGATNQYNSNAGNATDEANRQAAATQGLIGNLLS